MDSYLNRIDLYVQTLIKDGEESIWPLASQIARKFKLTLVSTSGTTRVIFKKKGSNKVIKIGFPAHNRAEYATYKALECSTLGKLLAPCLGISDSGTVMEMSFIPRQIPQSRGDHYWFSSEFTRLRDRLETHYSFIKGYNKYSWGADFHEENMRVERNGDIKLIDYSNLLVDMFNRKSDMTVSKAIRGICKLEFPRVNITLQMKKRMITYQDDDISYEVSVASSKSPAII
tara:strand:- start:50 stop:739 length:690 start_codon:yes stop_codon:yes gene_type:complete